MKKILIVLFGVLIFQGYVFAESWEDRAAKKLPGVLKTQMIPLVGIRPLGGTPRIHGSWGRVIMRPIMGLLTVLGPAPRTIPVIEMVGRMRLQRQRHVSCGVLINLDMFV